MDNRCKTCAVPLATGHDYCSNICRADAVVMTVADAAAVELERPMPRILLDNPHLFVAIVDRAPVVWGPDRVEVVRLTRAFV